LSDFKETTTKTGEPIAQDYVRACFCHARNTESHSFWEKADSAIKKLGSYSACMSIERFIQMKVFLELTVKVRGNWRDDERSLQRFGYK
jgi:GTP-binding protein Era